MHTVKINIAQKDFKLKATVLYTYPTWPAPIFVSEVVNFLIIFLKTELIYSQCVPVNLHSDYINLGLVIMYLCHNSCQVFLILRLSK